MERKLAAIMAADVAGFSRLMGADEEATLGTLSAYRVVIDGLVAQHNGRVFASAGDSVLAEFASPVEAVRCAVDIQRAVKDRNDGLEETRRMRFRMGVNLGDVMVKDDDLFGDGVNVASRLEGLAEPGGICIADSVFQQVKNKLQLGYESLGAHEVKNIAEPVMTYRVLMAPEAVGQVLGAARPTISRRRLVALAALGVAALVVGGGVLFWQPWAEPIEPEEERPFAFPEIVRPTRHFKVQNPADLSPSDAYTIYDRIAESMAAIYRKSGDSRAAVYQTWRRYNVTPYLSATHGERYVNNYANDVATAYGKFEEAGTLPQGSILAKDAFEVRAGGDVLTGGLGLMEKMAPGFNPESRDWRYTMILSDGTIFGTTKGDNAERVEFCIECHQAAGDENDHLFFIPEEHRVQFLNPAGVSN
jgi:class 3 adenylate cyclase